MQEACKKKKVLQVFFFLLTLSPIFLKEVQLISYIILMECQLAPFGYGLSKNKKMEQNFCRLVSALPI